MSSITAINILHLYPDLLNLYGDFGNILALFHRAKRHNITICYHTLRIGDSRNLSDYDLFFMGGGQDSEQSALTQDILARKDELTRAIENDIPMLAICGGYQLLGREFITVDNTTIPGLGILPITTRAGEHRLIGNTMYHCDLLKDTDPLLLGFENHSGRSYLDPDAVEKGARPLARVLKGYGNNDDKLTEGCIYHKVVATYSHGSFLPKNPAMTDFLLAAALEAANKRQGVCWGAHNKTSDGSSNHDNQTSTTEYVHLPYELDFAERLARQSVQKLLDA